MSKKYQRSPEEVFFTSRRKHKKLPELASMGSHQSADGTMFSTAFNGQVIKRFIKFLKPHKTMLWVSVGAVLLFTFTQMGLPLVIRYVVDSVLIGKINSISHKLLFGASAVFFMLVVLNYGANLLQESIVSRIAEQVLFDLRRAMYRHLQNISLKFMDRTEVGRLMSRLQGDVYALQEFLESSVFAIGDLVLLIGIIVILLMMNIQLGLITVAIIPALLGVRAIWLPFARRAYLTARESSSNTNGALAESINGVRLIQEMGREAVNFDLFEEKAFDNLKTHLYAARFSEIMIPIVDTLSGLALGLVVLVGGSLSIKGTIELGVAIAFFFYVQRFFAPIRSITMQYSMMQRAMASGQRIFEVLDVPIQIEDAPNALELTGVDGSIRFDHVTFGYSEDNPILHDISFKINDGETVALVGPTGSGKTSITSLVHRFYDPWQGKILVANKDVKMVTQASLGHHIGMVLQEPFLFTGTIRENIRYAKKDVSDETIKRAATAVGANEFISLLPRGYETVLEQRGSNLSLGQRQLISFARAIVADTRILVLDEATANIDSYTEMKIQAALKTLLQGRTALVIAHRLATIRNADRIIVLQGGRLIEEGTHDELIKEGNLYAQLDSMHYASFDDIKVDNTT
jgi:ATP-binding cassette subfamily B protein